MFRMRFTPVVALVALLTLRTSPGLAQARAGDGPDASASTDGVSELDSDIAARDSTRAVLAEDEARIQVDQVRLDSLESSLTDTREAAPHDADATRRAAEGVKGGRKSVAHDVRRTRHERELLAELQKKVDAEQAALSARSTLSVDPGSPGHR
jgi:hypothetical protein